MKPRTLFEKIWDHHCITEPEGGEDLIYVDLHLVHEVTSPQAFAGLRNAGRRVRRPERTVATVDHNVPTRERSLPIADHLARAQIEALRANVAEFGIEFFDMNSPGQGIVHVIGPELGLTQPGMTIVCGDSHTSTHGAFGALAFGIGTSQVEHVLATQCLRMKRPCTMNVEVDGELSSDATAKDLALHIIRQIGVEGGRGMVLEYTGEVIRALGMEARMTVCNMSIEAGARAGLISPDDTTVDYLRGRERVPSGGRFEEHAQRWRALATDPDARFDRSVTVDAGSVEPLITWGTNPAMASPVSGRVPERELWHQMGQPEAVGRALTYMGLEPGVPLRDVSIDRVFIGSCTNGRIEDLRAAADVLRGRRVATGVQALIVPGSTTVRQQAEREGLAEVFHRAGADWREAGCSMCLGMNDDILAPGERCVSTSNRNFEGRQGRGGRTHLASPGVAAASAVMGAIARPTDLPSPGRDRP